MVSIKGLYYILRFPLQVLYQIIQYIFKGGPYRKYKNSLVKTLKITLFRTCVSLPVLDAKFISFLNTNYVLNKHLPIRFKSITSTLNNYGKRFDENSFWLVEKPNRTKEDPVLLYLHGGGYFIELCPVQIESVLAIYKLVDAPKRENLSILVLDYKLACHGYKFPYQINQLEATYKNLAQSSSNIIFFGDSAGGNMALVYLQKLKIQQFNLYPSKLILISPWVKLVPGHHQFAVGKSYFDNTNRDIIDLNFLDPGKLIDIIGDIPHESLEVSPGNKLPMVSTDYDDIPPLRDSKSDVFVLVGEDESFRDDVLEWAECALDVPFASKYRYGDSNNVLIPEKHTYTRNRGPKNPHVRLYVEPWGLHDAVLYLENDALLKIRNDPKLTVDKLDHESYFGITRITEFLNDTL